MRGFPETLDDFLDAHVDLFSEEERALLTHPRLLNRTSVPGAEYREVLSDTIALYAAKLDQKQAEANERHAKAMKWLTIALFVAAALEAVGTVVAALIALGVIG